MGINTNADRRKITLIFLLIAGALLAVTSSISALSPHTAYACSGFASGDSVQTFQGAAKLLTDASGIRADLDPFNPDPVHTDSSVSFWVMLSRYAENWVQAGWLERDVFSGNKEYVFAEYSWDGIDGWADSFYDAATDGWGVVPKTQPPSRKTYTVEFDEEEAEFSFMYDGGSTGVVGLSWLPNRINVAGEEHNYKAVSGTDKGDHVPGDNASRVQALNIQSHTGGSGSWADADFAGTDKVSPQGAGGMSWIGSSLYEDFEIWDTRC